MTELHFEFDWEEPQGAQGPELRATWARLKIRVGQEPVTRVLHSGLKSVREYVYVPLYPLAEWIASHWWALLYETQPRSGFYERHNLRRGREGFTLPDLEILPVGHDSLVQWRSRRVPDWPVEFLETGTAYVPSSRIEEELSRLVEASLARLESEGIHSTYLHEEWSRIQGASEEEKEFCRAAAALGLDPFASDEDREELILTIHERLGERPKVEREFLHAADLARIPDQLDHLCQAEKELRSTSSTLKSFRGAGPCVPDPALPPWEQGYRLARTLRQDLRLEEERFSDAEHLARVLSSNGLSIHEVESADLFDALVGESEAGGPVFALDRRKRREESRAFAFSRALGEWLSSGNGTAGGLGLVTGSQTERQRRNRAFAAELLAPAALLAREITSETVGVEVLDRLAEQFSVSPWVIEHQLENHRLVREILQ